MFSSTITALSIKRENTSARPARIIVLIELPPKYSAMNAASADSGIDRNTADSRAKAPEEDQDHERGQHEADPALVEQRLDRALHEQRLVEHDVRSSCDGTSTSLPTRSFTPSTTAMVFVSPPCFITGRYTDGWPSTCTMLFWI